MITNPEVFKKAVQDAVAKPKKVKKLKSKVVILSVIKRTPCGQHAWVETNKGVFRKPINAIPAEMLK